MLWSLFRGWRGLEEVVKPFKISTLPFTCANTDQHSFIFNVFAIRIIFVVYVYYILLDISSTFTYNIIFNNRTWTFSNEPSLSSFVSF